ncbi:hypothetical protein KKF29_02415, partial [Patescibacteria group bacterium]|nr:hypothetical protein [Patescibacteria group bacterium]
MKKFYFFCFITIIIFFPLFSSNADTFSNCQDSCLEACNGFTADYPDQGSCIEPDVNECQFQCASDCMAGGFTTYTEVQDSVFNICSGTVQEGEYITDCPAQCEIECMDNSSCTLTDLDGCINSCGSSCTNDSTTPAELTTIVSNYCIDEDIEVSGGSSTIATTTYETEELSNPIGATSVVEIVGNVTQALLA